MTIGIDKMGSALQRGLDEKFAQHQREALISINRRFNKEGATPEVSINIYGVVMVGFGPFCCVSADDYITACRDYRDGRNWRTPFADLAEEIAQAREAQATFEGVA